MTRTILTNGTMLNGRASMTPVPDTTIVVEQDTITDIFQGPVPPEMEGEESRILDLHGHYVMPGLIDLNVYLPGTGKPERKGLFGRKKERRNGPGYRMNCSSAAGASMNSGVTTLLSLNADPAAEKLVRDWIQVAGVDGPRILTGSTSCPSDGITETLVSQWKEAGVHMVWLELQEGRTVSAAGIGMLHEAGIRAGARTDDAVLLSEAAEAGADLLAAVEKPEILSALMDRFPEKQYLMPPLCTAAAALSENRAAAEEKIKAAADLYRKAAEKGIPIGIGSGAGGAPVRHGALRQELVLLEAACSCGARRALYAGTGGNAAACGMPDRLGTIEIGKCADLLVTPGNPAEDLTALWEPGLLLVRGAIIIPQPVLRGRAAENEKKGIQELAEKLKGQI